MLTVGKDRHIILFFWKEQRIMKATGIVRKVDQLGRVVLPIELRRTLDVAEKDALEIFVDGDAIMLKKHVPGCVFCSNVDKLIDFQGRKVCKDCTAKLSVIQENRSATVAVEVDTKKVAKMVDQELGRIDRMRRSGALV
jgi:transcriptional pleiotropic regulator of transition state genes